MLTIEPRMVSMFWACSPISFINMSFWCSFLDPHLTTYLTNRGVQIITNVEIRHVYFAWGEPGDIFCFCSGE